MNGEDIYTEQIVPLIKQIDAIAIKNGIPFVLLFQMSREKYILTHFIPPDAMDEMHQLVEWLQKE